MMFALKLITSRMAGPVASVIAILLLFALLGQCQATGSVKRALAKSEKQVVAVRTDLLTCKANTSALTASLDAQNAALTAKSAADAQRLAEAGKGLSEALRGRDRAEARAAKLLKAGPVGVDVCARAIDAFETVKEQAR
jgi:hypothetical protein